jgi:hypothetical protein
MASPYLGFVWIGSKAGWLSFTQLAIAPEPDGCPEGVEGDAGAIGKGVLKVGAPPPNGSDLARPVFGQISKRVVKLKNTLDPLTVPRFKRSVLAAPAPL